MVGVNPVRSRWYRILVSPKTFYLFRKFFKLAGEPRPLLMALRYTWRTI